MIVVCSIPTCRREVNPKVETVWERVEGWTHKREQGGDNHIALKDSLGIYMCDGCMQKLRLNIPAGQVSLL